MGYWQAMLHSLSERRNQVGRLVLAILALFMVGICHKVAAEDPPGEATKKTDEAEKIRKVIDDVLGRHAVFPSPESKEPLQVIPALRWSNNTRGTLNALTVLYVRKGRPYAVACLFPYDRGMIHDFQSLCRESDIIVARRGDETVWRPEKAGVTYVPIPDAPAPKASRAERLLQMKQLSDRFESTMLGWKADTNDQEKLRLLPRPIYRYEPEKGPVVDGAVFAFVQGTDPESILLIELVQEEGQQRWVYAWARRTAGKLEGRLDGKVVWTAPLNPEYKDPRLPQFTVHLPLNMPPRAEK
jgi:hypothetical protein